MDITASLFTSIRLRLASIALALVFAPMAQADVVTDNAANWLIAQQITTGPTAGAFPWTPGQAATQNTQGASALGLLRAWERSGNPAYLAAALANGDCQINNCVAGMAYGDGHHRFATHDPLFLEQLSIDSGDPQYAGFVDSEFWSRLAAGTYGASANLDAAGYANTVLGTRTSQNIPELAAWDLSKAAIAAQLAGETVARDAFMQAILGSLNASDATHTTYDVVGLTGAIWASAVTGIDLDPTSGKWASANSTAQLANMLLAWQAPGGGFVGSTSAAGGVIDSNADAQTTAFAMQALDALNASAYATEITSGFIFITGLQQPSGEFLGYIGATPGSQGAVESHGETLEAYAAITQRPSAVYVDDDFLGDTPGQAESFTHPQVNGGVAIPVIYGVDAFASISAALAEVQLGGTVYVAKGLYPESDGQGGNLVIRQAVSVIGEQAGVDARTRSSADADETIVVPAVAQAGLGLGSYETSVVDISGGGIVLDGLVIDGDNPALNSGVALNGADPDVAGGIYAQDNDNDLQNLVVRNIIYAGIDGYAIGTAVAGNIIRHNRFANITRPSLWGRGIILQENFYAQVTDNLFGEVRVGVQTNNNHRAAPGGFVPMISGNEIHATRTGIFHNLFYQNAATYQISGNQFIAVANAGETGEWSGLWIESMQSAQTTIISGNIVDGSAVVGARQSVGYLLNNITSSAAASTLIEGGTVSDVGVGVQATDATYYTGPVSDIVTRNVSFSDIALGAFYVEDTTEQVGTARLTIGGGNLYSDVVNELVLAGTAPQVGFTDGETGVARTLVRSARNYYNDPSSAAYTVANASINQGIGYTQVGGTVSVEAGTFSSGGLVNKMVSVEGAFAGIAGFDALRNGSGETIVSPASGAAFTLAASGAVVDGFTLTVASGVAVGYGGASRDNMQLINNRVVDIGNGVGIRFEPGEGTPASGLQITGNLFSNINGSGTNGAAIQLYKGTRDAVVSNNHIDSARTYAIQVNGGNGSVQNTTITGNVISDSLALGTFNAFVATNVTGMLVRDNTVSGVATGLFISDKDSDLEFVCNSITGANRGISASAFFGGIANTGIRILDNAIVGSVTADVNNGLAQDLVVGSNWYGGGNAVVTGSNAYVADGLPVNPIGNAACGANVPTAIVAYAGSGQSTLVNTAFANPLQARVIDALGGAVTGETVSFSAPMSGASAVLGTVSGTSNFNGVLSSTVTANNLAGSYVVNAGSGALSPQASFSLTNDPIIGTVTWDELSFVYDGNTHVATAHITEEPGTACVVTPVFGPNVGDYAVSATCNGTTYAASGTNTASITPAAASLALSNLVQVFDGTPKPATVTSTPSGVAYSVTYNGSATAPSAIGLYAVVATITDGNYSGPQASGVLQIIEADAPDLAVTITDDRNFVQYGSLLTYTIVVNNPGNTTISGASVTSDLPITLLNVTPSWQCVQVSPGASCTASGTGNLNETALSIPAGGGVVYLFNAEVKDEQSLPTDRVETTVTVTAPGDLNPGNDSATDTTQIVIFRDGFDPGGDGAEDVESLTDPEAVLPLESDTVAMLDLATAWSGPGRIVELARLGEGEARVQVLRTSNRLLVRLQGREGVSAWTAVAEGTTGLALALAEGQLLLVGGDEDLQLLLGPGASRILHLPRG